MNSRRFKLKRREEPSPNLILTPFIDVLLVVVCFVLSIAFNIQFAVNVSLPEAQTGQMVLEKTLAAVVQRDGTLIFQGKAIGIDGFPALLAQTLQTYPKDQKPQAVIQGDEEIPYSLLIQVMDIFRSQGILDLSLLTKKTGSR